MTPIHDGIDFVTHDVGAWLTEIVRRGSGMTPASGDRGGLGSARDAGADQRELREAVGEAIRLLDSGEARVAEPGADGWTVNQWLKKAVLLSFRLNPMAAISGGPGGAHWWDKVPSQVRRLERRRVRGGGLPRRARRDRPARRLCRARARC